MNQGLQLLDELEFVQAELSTGAKQATLAPALPVPISVSGSPHAHVIPSPFFIRSLNPLDLSAAWRTFCALLRKHGVPIFSPVPALSKVPASEVPARWSGRDFGRPFALDELTTADLFEVRCHDQSRQRWQWPSEIQPSEVSSTAEPMSGPGSDTLASLLSSVRLVAGGDVPIGVCLPLGCHSNDLRRCLSADLDFISLVSRRAELSASDLCGLVHCRQLCEELNRPRLPVLVSAPVARLDQAIKLIALGATAVSIDTIVKPIIQQALNATATPQDTSDLRRKLPSLALALTEASKPLELPGLDAALVDAKQSLVQCLRWIGAEDLSHMNRHSLCSTSERAQHITGTPRLSP